MLNDTSLRIKDEFKKRIMQMAPDVRMKMGSRMFDAGRSMVLSSLEQTENAEEKREQLFLRLYGNDFTEADIKRIKDHLRKHFGGQ